MTALEFQLQLCKRSVEKWLMRRCYRRPILRPVNKRYSSGEKSGISILSHCLARRFRSLGISGTSCERRISRSLVVLSLSLSLSFSSGSACFPRCTRKASSTVPGLLRPADAVCHSRGRREPFAYITNSDPPALSRTKVFLAQSGVDHTAINMNTSTPSSPDCGRHGWRNAVAPT
jgi:hypothetical protein